MASPRSAGEEEEAGAPDLPDARALAVAAEAQHTVSVSQSGEIMLYLGRVMLDCQSPLIHEAPSAREDVWNTAN